MKKFLFGILLAVSLFSLSGCSSELLPEGIQEVINEKTQELKSKAVQEFEEALSEQVKEFFSSNDLQESLGLSDEQQEKVQGSMKEYLESYDSDPQAWKDVFSSVQEKLTQLKENGELDLLTAEELNEKLDEILSPPTTSSSSDSQ